MRLEVLETLACPKCKRVLPISGFYPDKTRPHGVGSSCKTCKAEEWAAHRLKNPERHKLAHRLRALRHILRKRYEVKGDFTLAQVLGLWEAQEKTCYYCGDPIEMGEISLDHKTPVSRGGTHSMFNLAATCKSCNFTKQDMTEEEFRAYIGSG